MGLVALRDLLRKISETEGNEAPSGLAAEVTRVIVPSSYLVPSNSSSQYLNGVPGPKLEFGARCPQRFGSKNHRNFREFSSEIVEGNEAPWGLTAKVTRVLST